jgi:hypothetical protein
MAYKSYRRLRKPIPRNVICPQAVEDAPTKFNRSALQLNGRHANIPSDIAIDSWRRHTPAK